MSVLGDLASAKVGGSALSGVNGGGCHQPSRSHQAVDRNVLVEEARFVWTRGHQ